jgi:hypothetical protein
MAFVNGNKPIVTNGLVYALDFGNQKSYVSGSSSARSLLFNPVTASVSAGFDTATNALIFSSSQNATTNLSFTQIDVDKSFTISYVANIKGNGIGFGGNYIGPILTSTFNTTTTEVGFYGAPFPGFGNTHFNRTYGTVGNNHYTWAYSSGSSTFFINGIPVTASSINSGVLVYNGGEIKLSGRASDSFWSGSINNFFIYNKALSSAEIWSNYQLSAQRYSLGPQTPKPYVDENAYLFLQSAGITDPIITSSINTFVLGLKSASLWDKMIAIYPFVGTGSVGVNLTGSHKWNLKEPSLVTYPLIFTGSWNGSVSGSTPSGSGTAINTTVTPSTYYPNYSTSSAHISILSYDTPVSSSILAGTGMTKELAISTLAGDYGTPAAAYSVRKVRTAYSGALMDVRRDYDNTTGSVGYVSSGDLDTGSLLDFVVPGRSTLPGNYSGLAAAYSLRRVSGSYTGSAIDVRRIWDNTTSSIGFDASGNLDTGSLLSFTTSGSNVSTYSNDFTQGVWTKYFAQITSSAIIGPYGLGSGSFINETAVNNYHSLDGTFGGINTLSTHSISIFVKKQERRYVGLGFAYDANRGITTVFDLDTTSSVSSGSIGPGYSVVSSSINYVIDGWFRISLTGTSQQDAFFPRFFLATSSAQINVPYPIYVGEPGTGSYVYGFQYTTGSTVQPYIETTGTARYNVGNTSSFGYVTKWYDQSGNARHAAQTATGSQPLIVSSGSLIIDNNKPALDFNGTSNYLSFSNITATSNDSIFMLGRRKTDSSFGILLSNTTTTFPFFVGQRSDDSYQYRGYNNYANSSSNTTTQDLLSSFAAGFGPSGGIMYKNSTLLPQTSYGPNTFESPWNSIGVEVITGTYNYSNAYAQEILLYSNTNLTGSRTLIENNINTYYSIYTSSAAGYVTKWYDQSGNNNHATQTATGSQPQIVNSGSVIFSGTKPSLYWKTTGLDNLQFTRISNIQTVFHISQLVETGSNQSFLLGDTDNFDYHAGTTDPQTWFSSNPPAAIRSSPTNYINGINLNLDYSSGVYRTLNRNLITLIHTSAIGRANQISVDRGANPRSWRGYIQEITLYTSSLLDTRQPLEYGINNYYNIYPQTSSFSTSSFAIYATTSSISASINNDLQSGIASTGPLGFITVSRTGSNSLTLSKNGVTSSFSVPASGALSTNLYLGAINNNGIALGSSPYNISFASVGVGLTGTEISTLNNLTQQLQANIGRGYILDFNPGAIAAFSLRKLRLTYTGSAINVRRSSDNNTADIGFDGSGNLDVRTLTTFCGLSTGYVTTWYDQTGNNNHVSQSTLSSQPIIVTSGSIVTAQTFQTRQYEGPNGANNNTLPAIYFNAQSLSLGRTLYSTNQISYYVLFNLGLLGVTSDGYSVMATNTGNGSAWSYQSTGGGPSGYINMFQQPNSSRRESFPSNMPKGGTILYSGYHTGSEYTVYVNNVTKGTNTTQQFGSGSFLDIGKGEGQTFRGSIQEIIFYPTGSTTNRFPVENNINTFYRVY